MKTRTTLRKTLNLIREDLSQREIRQGKVFRKFSYIKIFLNPPAMAGVIFRFQHWFYCCGCELIAELLRSLNIIWHSVDIGSAAEIGGGLVIYHPNCIVITGKLKAGKNLHLAHHNTIEIGPRPGLNAQLDRIEIGDEVVLGGGGRILGNVSVGHDSLIGVNAVVTESIEPYSLILDSETAAMMEES